MEKLVLDDEKFSVWEFLNTNPELTGEELSFLNLKRNLNLFSIPLKLFLTACHNNYFTDEDGVGELLSADGSETGYKYKPSEIEDIPDGYTYVQFSTEKEYIFKDLKLIDIYGTQTILTFNPEVDLFRIIQSDKDDNIHTTVSNYTSDVLEKIRDWADKILKEQK